MDAKAITKKGYELFNSGDMQTFFTDIVHDDITWTFPGKEGKHPLSGVHKGKEAVMAAMSKIPATWSNFHLTPEFMISEGDKVFVKVNAKADGMDTVFGHYFEVKDGKMITMMTFDDTLSMFDSMNK
jgi:ketosteroid isomerase-like protein|tara:strand:- start:44 stop:424 length:381 start_codon:yes stop_codon:yes gene_type:complete